MMRCVRQQNAWSHKHSSNSHSLRWSLPLCGGAGLFALWSFFHSHNKKLPRIHNLHFQAQLMWAAGNEPLALFVGCPVLAQVLRSCIQGIWWDPTCNYIRVPSEELAIRRGTHTPSPCSHTKGSQTKSLFFPKIKIFWKGPILLELLLSGSALSALFTSLSALSALFHIFVLMDKSNRNSTGQQCVIYIYGGKW